MAGPDRVGCRGTLLRRGPVLVSLPRGTGEPLTARHLALLWRVRAGDSNAQIAAYHRLAVQTVKNDLSDAYRRLGARNRTHAVTILAALVAEGERETPPT